MGMAGSIDKATPHANGDGRLNGDKTTPL